MFSVGCNYTHTLTSTQVKLNLVKIRLGMGNYIPQFYIDAIDVHTLYNHAVGLADVCE